MAEDRRPKTEDRRPNTEDRRPKTVGSCLFDIAATGSFEVSPWRSPLVFVCRFSTFGFCMLLVGLFSFHISVCMLHVCLFSTSAFRPPGFPAWFFCLFVKSGIRDIMNEGYGVLPRSWFRCFDFRRGLHCVAPRIGVRPAHSISALLVFDLFIQCSC